LTSPSRFSEKTIDLESRSFSLQVIKFDNGFFVSVAESSQKLGSMVVSLATGPNTVTTTVIPSKTDSLFLKLIAERISTRMKGIAIVSAFLQNELKPDMAKAIMMEIMNLIQN
jgi:hypothetical protein